MLWNNGTIGEADGVALTLLCYTLAEWIEAVQSIADRGRDIPIRNAEGEMMDVREAPWTRRASRLKAEAFALLREFGMGPVSRSSVTAIGRGDDVRSIKAIT